MLDVPGWEVTSTESGDDGYGEVNYEKGQGRFTITWYPADSYESYVVDREHIVDPPAPGEPVEVLGKARPALGLQQQRPHRHPRGRGRPAGSSSAGRAWTRTATSSLLGRLTSVGDSGYEASLPQEFVTDDERKAAIAEMLDGIAGVTGAQGPEGTPVRVRSNDQDPYQLGAAVAGAYACAWLEAYENAVTHDQPGQAAEAARVLGTSRDWPVLIEMSERGDYPEVVWDYGDTVQAGEVPEHYREGLGCSG